ncbi:MAG: FAD:protein transferase [Actinomycetota bacterium]|nr:FAD:protein transferase [Actinomycetota bacterium]
MPATCDQPRRAWVEHVMSMPVSIHVRGPLAREGAADLAVRAAVAELHRTEELFSVFRPDSEVSRIRSGALDPADADPLVLEVAALCRRAREITDGWFDADLPGPDGVRRFNPTGLVKGWVTERVTDRLSEALPDHDVLVNAGGDIAVRCRRTDTPGWSLGIEDPADRGRVLATVRLRTGGMATSGTAARGAHIVDPATGIPATGLRSVTVVGPRLLWADVQATAAFARGEACCEHLGRLDGHLSFVVLGDGSTRTLRGADRVTPRFPRARPATSQGEGQH